MGYRVMSKKTNLWMPIYWADYYRDTQHLDTTQHGAYLMLIGYYWTTGSNCTANAKQLYMVCRCTTDEQRQAVDYVIDNMFTKKNGNLVHKRINEELQKSETLSKIRADAAKSRYQNEGEQKQSKSTAKAEQLHTQLHIHTQIQSQLPSQVQDTVLGISDVTASDEALNPIKPKTEKSPHEKTKRSITTPFPEDERCPPEWANSVSRNTSLTQSEIDREYATARDWAIANGKRQADWPAFFRNWCRRAEQSRGSVTNKQKATGAAAVFARVVASAEARQRNEVLGDADDR